MPMHFEISEEDSKKAKFPHEIFLINLIFNHILVFVALLSASGFAHYALAVPVISAVILFYLFWGAQRARKTATWYVNGHWQLCKKRGLLFLGMIALMGLIFLILLLVSGGNLRPQHYAIGGAAALPTMVTVLILIIMESEALNQAKAGILPDWVKQKFPDGAYEEIEPAIKYDD